MKEKGKSIRLGLLLLKTTIGLVFPSVIGNSYSLRVLHESPLGETIHGVFSLKETLKIFINLNPPKV